jgi:hypothetical protein
MFNTKTFIVDDKGCITVNAKDAQDFLRLFGVHSGTGYAISPHVVEHSADPAKAPDGSYKHVWYYRFKECESTIYPYKKLDKPAKPEAPKRGYKKEESPK